MSAAAPQRTVNLTAPAKGTAFDIKVEEIPPLPVLSVKMTLALPTSVFSGPARARDNAVLDLMPEDSEGIKQVGCGGAARWIGRRLGDVGC